MSNEERAFGAVIQGLIRGQNLSRAECRDAFARVLEDGPCALHQGAFLAALAAKGETAAEVAGAWEAIDGLDTVHATAALPEDLVENSGTGMDRLETFNVSTAASLVAAAGGVHLARHGARALSSKCGAVDMAEALGVDVECSVENVGKSIHEAGLGLYNGMSAHVHPGALGRILSQIRFGSTLNIAASLANPARPRLAVRGVHHPDALADVAAAMVEIGYERALVVHGHDADGEPALDELSAIGDTTVLPIRNGKVGTAYRLSPGDVGLALHSYDAIAGAADRTSEVRRFVCILAGRGNDGERDTVALNAGAIFVVADEVTTLKEGVERARGIIDEGLAIDRLRLWVRSQNRDPEQGAAQLERVLELSSNRS